MRADTGPTHTLKEATITNIKLLQVPLNHQQLLLFLLFLQIMCCQDSRQKKTYNIPTQPRQTTLDLQAWNRLLELSLTCLCRASGLGKSAEPKECAAAALTSQSRLRNPAELLTLHLIHYHTSPAQFRHQTSSLRLPEDIHELDKDVVQGRERCIKKKPSCSEKHGDWPSV